MYSAAWLWRLYVRVPKLNSKHSYSLLYTYFTNYMTLQNVSRGYMYFLLGDVRSAKFRAFKELLDSKDDISYNESCFNMRHEKRPHTCDETKCWRKFKEFQAYDHVLIFIDDDPSVCDFEFVLECMGTMSYLNGKYMAGSYIVFGDGCTLTRDDFNLRYGSSNSHVDALLKSSFMGWTTSVYASPNEFIAEQE